MQTVRSSETSVYFYQTTRRRIGYQEKVTFTEHIVLFIKLYEAVSYAKVCVTTLSGMFGLDAL